ncbi:Abi family protein [Rothia nasisuis]|uniref:Abi family protein n=2 Tax=Rothia nasisuis TaxID=2109647 RepID=UPI001F43324E|nr:Abi family protein [Rothia nasisuis]
MPQEARPHLRTLSEQHVSAQRLKPYLEHSYNNRELAMRLYELDRRLSAELFYEIGILEVALRNSVDRYLTAKYGDSWIANPTLPMDQRTAENFHEAWDSLPANRRQESMENNPKLKGRLLAASMFRTWSNFFDKGGASGHPAPRDRADHDIIWTEEALKTVFPGAAKLAGRSGEKLNRDWAYRQVKEVHVLRNRIAHHESLINGYPLPGQEETAITPAKRSAADGLKACRTLAKMIDRHLAKFIAENSSADQFLKNINQAKP